MENRIGPVEMFYQKKGTKIRLKDGREIILTSNYDIDTLSYTYKEGDKTGTIACLELSGAYIIE